MAFYQWAEFSLVIVATPAKMNSRAVRRGGSLSAGVFLIGSGLLARV